MTESQHAHLAGDEIKRLQCAKELQDLYQGHKVSPLSPFMLPLVTGPVFISFFLALRDIAAVAPASFQTGGLLWFKDLGATDPYFGLPILAATSFLLITEKGMETGTPVSGVAKNVFRGLAVLMVPFTASFPAALPLYWFTNSLFSLAMTLVMKNARVKKMLDIPNVPAAVEQAKAPSSFMDGVRAGMAISEQDDKLVMKKTVDEEKETRTNKKKKMVGRK